MDSLTPPRTKTSNETFPVSFPRFRAEAGRNFSDSKHFLLILSLSLPFLVLQTAYLELQRGIGNRQAKNSKGKKWSFHYVGSSSSTCSTIIMCSLPAAEVEGRKLELKALEKTRSVLIRLPASATCRPQVSHLPNFVSRSATHRKVKTTRRRRHLTAQTIIAILQVRHSSN